MGVDDAVFLIQSQLTVINLISSLLQIVSSFSKEGLYLNEYRSFTKTKRKIKHGRLQSTPISQILVLKLKILIINIAMKEC